MSKLCIYSKLFLFPLCALNGSAYGGGVEIACACDFRIAVSNIEIMVPPAKIGIHYHPAGIKRFLNIFGAVLEIITHSNKNVRKGTQKCGFFDEIINEGENVIERRTILLSYAKSYRLKL